ncbi:short-chain dehydrogenase [Mycolicibacterium cyprinidarum]|uniref:Short-chain dehydrogenase n=1 Tax=Mycolicibacterium cyprinidarum TaxID=2860311 RepID=A0ABQ4V830_9MYCO|nr:short-chain dehydrogenase [Mycolicibacterium sp. NGTWSNA01]GJF13593.1 short-chain dehydrogenase [Mycolicibacterium sp. NGTWS1803]GJF14033.1 short-chain dehydrogenase [Mycolicibacterium sp. NGTWS0302]
MGSVAGKTVFITGGARGVGAEVARRLHGKGARLVLTDLDAAPLTELAEMLGSDRVHTILADVRDLGAMESAAANAVDRFGGIDIVMANAGIATYGSVLQVDPEAFQTLLDVNVMGVFHTVRATLPSVLDRRGYVLIVSSLAAYAAAPGLAPYNATKAAVEHFANALRLEVAHRGVDVGSAHMSWIDTPLVRDIKADLSTFGEMLSKLPFPLNKTTSVEACGEAFVSGIEHRSRRVNCPAWVGALRWLKPLLSTPVGERQVAKFVPGLLPRMDAEVAALGRSMSSRTTELEKQ